jgi:hypothetical protein
MFAAHGDGQVWAVLAFHLTASFLAYAKSRAANQGNPALQFLYLAL